LHFGVASGANLGASPLYIKKDKKWQMPLIMRPGLIPMEIKQRTSLLEWKVKMLQFLPIIVKVQVLHP